MTDDIMALDTLIKDKNFENVKVWEFLGGLIQFCCVLSAFNVSTTFKRIKYRADLKIMHS